MNMHGFVNVLNFRFFSRAKDITRTRNHIQELFQVEYNKVLYFGQCAVFLIGKLRI